MIAKTTQGRRRNSTDVNDINYTCDVHCEYISIATAYQTAPSDVPFAGATVVRCGIIFCVRLCSLSVRRRRYQIDAIRVAFTWKYAARYHIENNDHKSNGCMRIAACCSSTVTNKHIRFYASITFYMWLLPPHSLRAPRAVRYDRISTMRRSNTFDTFETSSHCRRVIVVVEHRERWLILFEFVCDMLLRRSLDHEHRHCVHLRASFEHICPSTVLWQSTISRAHSLRAGHLPQVRAKRKCPSLKPIAMVDSFSRIEREPIGSIR